MSAYLPTVFAENLMDVFDDFDRSFFRGFDHIDRALYGKNAQHMMKTDVRETQDGYELDVDLPGIAKEDVNLALENGYLTISARKGMEKNEENDAGRLIRRERYAGTMQRSFYVGENVTQADVKAAYQNGVLHISFPKREAVKAPERNTIYIEG